MVGAAYAAPTAPYRTSSTWVLGIREPGSGTPCQFHDVSSVKATLACMSCAGNWAYGLGVDQATYLPGRRWGWGRIARSNRRSSRCRCFSHGQRRAGGDRGRCTAFGDVRRGTDRRRVERVWMGEAPLESPEAPVSGMSTKLVLCKSHGADRSGAQAGGRQTDQPTVGMLAPSGFGIRKADAWSHFR